MDRESLILKYKKYAEKIAYFYIYTKRVPDTLKNDVVSISYIGLIKAIDTYDDSKNASLETWIRNKIFYFIPTELRDKYDVLNRTTRLSINTLNKIKKQYLENYNRTPTKEELQIEYNKIRNFDNNTSFNSVYLLSEFRECDVRDCFNLKFDDNFNEQVENKDLFFKLKYLIPSLNKKEQHCIKRYYIDEIVMSQIAIEIGITESRVSQILDLALNKLRRWFQNDLVMRKAMTNNDISSLSSLYPEAGERRCKCGEIIPAHRKVSVCAKCWGEQRHRKKKDNPKPQSKSVPVIKNDKSVILDFTNDMDILEKLKIISKNKRRTIENQIIYMIENILTKES